MAFPVSEYQYLIKTDLKFKSLKKHRLTRSQCEHGFEVKHSFKEEPADTSKGA